MKRKCIFLLVMTMLLLSMVGCAGSAEKKEAFKRYESDMEVLISIEGAKVEDGEKTIEELIDDLESLSMSTEEGERVIKTYIELLDLQCEIWEVLDYWDEEWESAGHSTLTIDWIFEKEGRLREYGYTDKEDDIKDESAAALRDFWSAAEEAGFDEDDYSEFWSNALRAIHFLTN